MEEEEIPEPSVLDFSLEESLRTCVQNLGQQELPHPTARDLLQEQNVRTLGGTAENKGPADLTTEDPLLDDEIFILVLYPSDDYNAPLLGRKERLQLTPYGSLGSGLDDRGYEAISYTWGTNAYGGLISIDGNDLPIPFNLELALLRIRDDEQERRIWVDAVCINTPNLVERSHRFSKVRQIFQNAETVLIWLGEESENNPGALRFLSSTKTWNMSNEPSDKYLAMMWQSLQEFLMHAYFTRVCVVQEIVVARRIIVLHGTDSLDWTTMREAITIFYRRLVDRKIESEDANAKVSRAISFVSNIDKCSHWIGGHGAYRGTWSPALNLEELVFMFSTTESSDPRNKIHSLLSIAVDVDAWESNERFPEDSRTWEEIQKVFYMSCMKYSQSLDVIFRPWRQHQSSPWLLHQANDSEYTASLIGAPPGESPYSLFRGYTLSSELKSLNVLGDDRIHTSAYLFDEVETVTDAHDTLDVPLPRRWLSKIGRLRGSQFVHNLLPKTIEEDHETIFKLVCFLKDMANDSENDEDYFHNLKYGVPPVTEQHYAFEPNPPDYEPVLDNDFLMHRFTCSVDEDCLEDAVCLERIPKRIDRPVPWNHSDAPDLGIGWGLQLEEGYSNRVCMAFLVGILVSAIMGVVWSIVAKDLQSGFVVASWMVTSEAIMVGAVQLLLIFRAI
ncbi:hypothetical protein J4E85_008274 [Alternaria conjuncta]|uniref:uncharacterized protein n=1 Tax=Alternaria conjuncta TaxID=181017 RepID=UPI002220BFB6|nr:uncharacterized protein J4E85_008274 [Alternaria conjuncta]KAI4924114.1 hypothetical protein J4E85_008274 [Alternaria conjuncta]